MILTHSDDKPHVIDPATAFDWARAERADIGEYRAVSVTKDEVATLNEALETAYKWVDMDTPMRHAEIEGWLVRSARSQWANDQRFQEGVLSREAFKNVFASAAGSSGYSYKIDSSEDILLGYMMAVPQGAKAVIDTLEGHKEVGHGDEIVKVGDRGYLAGQTASTVARLLTFCPPEV